jgi:hypothetical protein
MSQYYKSLRITGWIIVDEHRNVINRSPSKDELKGLDKEPYIIGKNKLTCDNCKEKLVNPLRERDKEGKHTGRWICHNCWQKYDPNSQNNLRKLSAGCRTGNQNPSHECTKGDKGIELTCILYGWENLNKKYDSYTTPIDCYDPNTGLYHQVQGRSFNSGRGFWEFGFERDWTKEFVDMACLCFSKDGKIVERIYILPKKEIERVKTLAIVKNPTDAHGNPIIPRYEQYRITDEKELKKANEIWKNIINN